MVAMNGAELAAHAIRSLAEALPAATTFKAHMIRDGERVIAETEAELKATGEHNEAFSLAAAEFRRVAAAVVAP